VDFEKTALATALRQAGMDLNAPMFFSLLGVTQYLTEEALDQTLQFILSGCGGSEIVFSFVVSDTVLAADDIALVKAFTAQFAATGEPWISRFHPDQLVARLRSMGFSHVFHLSPEEANHRYFRNRRDGLNASIAEQMIRAIV
jgi:O-methyltransferase involved in polyketide biosynthesis